MCGVSKFSKFIHQKQTFSFSLICKQWVHYLKRSFRTRAAKCRELLIRNLMYIVEKTLVGKLYNTGRGYWEARHHLLLGSAPKENGVILEAVAKPSRGDLKRKKRRKKERKLHYKKLSVPFLTWSLKVQMPLGGARRVRRLSRKRKTNDHRFNEESITRRKFCNLAF